MKKEGEAYESLNEIKRRFESKYPEFDSSWRQMVKTAGIGLVNEMKDKLKIEYQFLKQLTDFKFRIIVDNNFVFGQIKGLLKKKGQIEDSFLFKLLLSKSVQMFAPPKLQEELIAKIHSVLKEEDHDLALEYASVLTSKLRIEDAEWIDDWKKANQMIGEKDEDDVPYLALAFAVDGHAIISFDKVFQNQGDVKVWEFGEADRIITNYHSGILSFALAGATMNLLVYLISIIGKLIRDIFLDLINLLKQLAKGVITALSKIPSELILILTAFGLLAFFTSDELQQKGKDFAELTKKAIARLREMLKNVGEFLTNLIEFVGPVAVPTLEFLAYLMAQYHEMEKELDLLENKRG